MDWLRRHRKEDNLTNQNIKFQFSNEMLSSLSKVISASFDVNEASKLSDNWSFWSEGSISVGKIGDTSSSFSKDINSNGITIGMDKKIDENKMYGYALRFGRDDVDVGTSGTSLDTEAYSLSLYGTFPHDDTKFIDSVLGIKPSVSTDGGTSDGRFIAPTGAEVVELGPVNASIHKINECIRSEDLVILSKIYKQILVKLFI